MRVGIYDSRQAKDRSKFFLEHIKKACHGEQFDVVYVKGNKNSSNKEFAQLLTALENNEIDIALIEGSKYIAGAYNTHVETEIIGVGKRRNPNSVLVLPKKKKNGDADIREAKVVTNNSIYQKQMELINENVICEYERNSTFKLLKMVIDGELEGALVSEIEIKKLKLRRRLGVKILEYDSESFVPVTGYGQIAAFIKKEKKEDGQNIYEVITKRASHLDSLEEIIVEQSVIEKLVDASEYIKENGSSIIKIDNVCVNAKVREKILTIAVFLQVYENKCIRVVKRGPLDEKNRVIQQTIEKIKNKIIY